MRISLVILAVAVAGFAFADGTGTGLSTPGSPHNFADEVEDLNWNSRAQLCQPCHVPHSAVGDTLWARESSNAPLPMYSSPSLDGAIAAGPTGSSKLCLGCHDGTVSLDQFGNGGTVFIGNPMNDLTRHHPISIEYDEIADPGLRAKDSPFGGSGTIADILEGGVVVQCASCHDAHDSPGVAVPGTHLLRVNQDGTTGTASGLCLACHIK